MAPSDLIALLDRYERPLIRYACSIVGDLDSARDVVQETFIKARAGRDAETPVAEGGMVRNGAPIRSSGSASGGLAFHRHAQSARSTINANTAASFP